MSNALSLEGSQFDVVALVEADHRAAKALFARVFAADADERAERWAELLHALAVHEVAEEMVVYPAIQSVLDSPDPGVEARLAEQVRAAEQLNAMEGLHPATAAFEEALRELEREMLEHAAGEERDVLPLVVRYDQALDRLTLGSRYLSVKERAPTRPHPHAPHRPPGNVLAGPLLSFVDRIRDHLA